MNWPTPQDYNEAIQNPRLCFSDPELQSGKPELTPLGLPKPISGNFASVYQVTCGTRRWAVRCFLREIPDHQRRYRAISDHLRASHLPFIVGFEFLSDGIRIAGKWYPILKMEWVDGEQLHLYVERHLRQPSVLQSLAKQWISILSSLRQASVAHGDLQHGNIVVSQGQIKLIDYDGMFVPSLAGWPCHEEGHRNYQHPARTGRDFGPYLDAFPGWVVLASLAVLAVDPHLWQLLNGGDECLLFRREDFENPGRSKAFQAILSSGHFELQTLVRHITSLLSLPLNQIPPADSSSPLILPRPAPIQSGGLPEWLQDNQQREGIGSLPPLIVDVTPPTIQENAGAAWLIDHLVDSLSSENVWAGVSFGPQRAMLGLGASSLGVLVALIGYGILPIWFGILLLVILAIGTGTILVSGYQELPLQGDKREARSRVSAASREVLELEGAIDAIQQRLMILAEPVLNVQQQYQQLPQRVQQSLSAAQNRYREAISANERETQGLVAEEIEKRRTAIGGSQRQTADLLSEKNRLNRQEQEELRNALEQMRGQHILAYMRGRTIAGARLRGIGTKLSERLAAAGAISAADVHFRGIPNVQGIGPGRASELKRWADSIRRNAESAAPTSLPSTAADLIRGKHKQALQSLQSQIEVITRRADVDCQQTAAYYSKKRQALDAARKSLEAAYDKERQGIQRGFDQDKDRLQKEFRRLNAEFETRKRVIETEHEQLSKTMLAKKIKLSKARRELGQYRRLTFGHYMRRVLSLG